MKQGTIYSLYCKESNRYYVGQTIKQVNQRWKEHLYEARRMSPNPLYKAIRKYGDGSFNIKIIEEVDVTLLDERETYWIEQYDAYSNGYNQTTGAGGQYRISEDVKEKISQTMTGKEKTTEHVSKISQSLKNKGHKFTIQGDGKHARRKIKTINVDTLEEKIWDSHKECADWLGATSGNLSRYLKNGWKLKRHRLIRIDERPISYSVYGVDKKTNRIKYSFKSISEAGRELGFNGQNSGCRKSLKHPHKYTWKGCYWFYTDSDKN